MDDRLALDERLVGMDEMVWMNGTVGRSDEIVALVLLEMFLSFAGKLDKGSRKNLFFSGPVTKRWE